MSYFQSISDAELEVLVKASALHTYEMGDILFWEGDGAQGLWLVEQGSIKIYKLSMDGREHILHLCGPGKTFNDIAAFDDGVNPANASVLSATAQVWLVPVSAIQHLMKKNPQVSLNVIKALSSRVRSLVGEIENLALYSVTVRLARFLLNQASDPSLNEPGITRTAIAAHINTTPQTVSVALRDLETAGAIHFNRHQLEIVNEGILRSIAML